MEENSENEKKPFLGGFIILLLAGIVLLLGAILTILNTDKTEPIITFPDTELIYAEGSDKSMLLEKVMAIDERDGDVSKSLIIENIIPLSGNEQATVIYVARDKNNNLAKANRIVKYIQEIIIEKAEKDVVQSISEEALELSPKETPSSVTPALTPSPAPTPVLLPSIPSPTPIPSAAPTPSSTPISSAAPVPTSTQAPITPFSMEPGNTAIQNIMSESVAQANGNSQPNSETVNKAAPKIVLNTNYITANVGDQINKYAYIAEATDDLDNAMQYLHIDGEYDHTKQGTYKLSYYILDADGNKSNVEVLTIKVE